MLKKLIILLLLLGSWEQAVWGIPAFARWTKVQQKDGRTISMKLVGDEAFHYRVARNGLPLVRNEAGDWVYARLNKNLLLTTPVLQATQMLAHDEAEQEASEREFVAQLLRDETATQVESLAASQTQTRQYHRMQRRTQPTPQNIGYQPTEPLEGTKKGLVILVNFKDVKMQATHTNSVFNEMMNTEGYNKGGHTGSVHDYFLDQSYGRLNIRFDVVGPITVSQKQAYYGANDANGDMRAGALVAEACEQIKDRVNFADYDWDGDKQLEQVYIIYAGYAESQDLSGRHPDWIWPHEWRLSLNDYGRSITFDGIEIDTYGMSSELDGDTGTQLAGIGTACHEFSHCLGLPDFYDTSGASTPAFGLNQWSLMDYGAYNDNGVTPCGYTAYERMFCGWLHPTELSSPCEVNNVQPLTTRAEAYIIYNDANRNEYYLLANHQKEKWDAHAAATGLMIMHVDHDEATWVANKVNNNKNRQRCTIIAADNSWSAYTLSGDLYPNGGRNTRLDNNSSPVARLYTPNSRGEKLMGKAISDIRETNGMINFKFMGGGEILAVPALHNETSREEQIYDLLGRKRNSLQRGEIGIVNGKKIQAH